MVTKYSYLFFLSIFLLQCFFMSQASTIFTRVEVSLLLSERENVKLNDYMDVIQQQRDNIAYEIEPLHKGEQLNDVENEIKTEFEFNAASNADTKNLTLLLEKLFQTYDLLLSQAAVIFRNVLRELDVLKPQNTQLQTDIRNMQIFVKNRFLYDINKADYAELIPIIASIYQVGEYHRIVDKYLKLKVKNIIDFVMKALFEKYALFEKHCELERIYRTFALGLMLEKQKFENSLTPTKKRLHEKFKIMHREFQRTNDLGVNMHYLATLHRSTNYTHLEVMYFSSYYQHRL